MLVTISFAALAGCGGDEAGGPCSSDSDCPLFHECASGTCLPLAGARDAGTDGRVTPTDARVSPDASDPSDASDNHDDAAPPMCADISGDWDAASTATSTACPAGFGWTQHVALGDTACTYAFFSDGTVGLTGAITLREDGTFDTSALVFTALGRTLASCSGRYDAAVDIVYIDCPDDGCFTEMHRVL